jgi:DNA-binding PadR family transcriptional regulator
MATNSKSASNLSPEYLLLGYLSIKPTHGYELYQMLKLDLGQLWHLSMSQIYSILTRLEAKLLIRSEEELQENQRLRRQFYLSDAGLKQFESWLFKPSPCSARALRIEFLTRYYFMERLYPEKIPAMVGEQILQIEHDLKILTTSMEKIHPADFYNFNASQLKIDQLQIFLNWFYQLLQKQSSD